MSVKLEKTFSFQASIHLQDKFLMNIYDFTLSMEVGTDNIREQNIAMERTEHFLTSLLQNSILVHCKNTDAIQKYKDAGLTICELPEEPYDQILSMVLILKLNSIMEDRLNITDLVLGSTLSEGVRFTVVSEVAENVFAGNHWWNKPTTCISDICPDITENNIVKLFHDESWAEIGLSWKEKGKK